MNLLLIDDHTLFREGLKHLLRGLDAKLVIDEAGSCAQAVAFKNKRTYDLILLDLKMPGVSDLEALAITRDSFPETPIVIVSGEENPRKVRATIEHGAMGFVPKHMESALLIPALRVVLAHGVYLPLSVLDEVPTPALEVDQAVEPGDALAQLKLQPKPMQVLRLLIDGNPNKVIQRKLNLSESTVKAHVSTVLRTLHARNRLEAVCAVAKLQKPRD